MRATTLAAYPGWLTPYEGNYPGLYRDKDGLPTAGLAFLVPLSIGLGLAWTVPSSGALATPADIHAGYEALFALPKGMGGGWYQSRVPLRLSPHSAAVLFAEKIASYEKALSSPTHVGPAWFTLPAVCQLARLRTDWADGSASPWPKLDAALARGDWAAAAAECWPKDAGPDPDDPSTAGRKTTQPKEYIASYRAVRALYLLAADYPGDELPDPLPDGAEADVAA